MKLHLTNSAIKNVTCLETDGVQIWMGSVNAVYSYSINDKTLIKVLDETTGKLTPGGVMSLMLDRARNLWIGTDAGDINIWNLHSRKMEYLRSGDTKFR